MEHWASWRQYYVKHNIFDDFAMTYENFMNALEM